MITPPLTLELSDIHHFGDWVRWIRKSRLKILFVTDSSITNTQTCYEFMDGNGLGCMTYDVHRAEYGAGPLQVNENPDEFTPHFDNFRFNATRDNGDKILYEYHVIFMFAVNGGASIPDDEIAALFDWMEDGGGIFATGDHSTLGERLATKIPRVATMRRWGNDDGVPPGTGPERIDTNQPNPNIPSQVSGASMVPGNNQADAYPQKITWVVDSKQRLSTFRVVEYPHEVLCHPTHGPIDVMPDHPHEGECVEPADIDLTAKVEFGPVATRPDEYPEVGGNRERPQIIAYGRNAHEYMQAKGEIPPRTFPMISVWDGHEAGGRGRVAVDSTWHHWYDFNIDDIVAAGGENWDKIGRYYLNLARYLSPPGVFRDRCWWEIVNAQLRYPFDEERLLIEVKDDLLISGRTLHESLARTWGPCGVVKFVYRNICDLRPAICKIVDDRLIRFPRGPLPECLSCPPFELISAASLGGMVEGTAPLMKEMLTAFRGGDVKRGRVETEEIQKMAQEGMLKGLSQLGEMLEKEADLTAQLSKSLRG